MKKLSIYILSVLLTCVFLNSCEIEDDGGYIQQYNLHGIWWSEDWDGDYDEIYEQQLYFDPYFSGTERYITYDSNGYERNRETSYFNWEWLDDRTLIMYFDNGDISRFDIYELNGFLLRGRLGYNNVYFTPL